MLLIPRNIRSFSFPIVEHVIYHCYEREIKMIFYNLVLHVKLPCIQLLAYDLILKACMSAETPQV